ncbi:hypothetical protein [Amycolatopsis sp. SID8362]|uniref:hypothetical protein n=1 Tax=Amycolatopsis sp. SID8362 TaxID=2690346 RepID=UPI00136EC1F6|nr:hypothetical protein [Amycolatopsis sp. SID8362]NBH01944.1 hypothetical protein [Amycolatopsis sp. SID8362]NED38647.1 hypothetical protein [Amycolatopsis sp. SID8362]
MTTRTRKAPSKRQAATTRQATEQEPTPKRRPDPRAEVVSVSECIVDGCPVLEFEPGRGLCMGHFTTRLDLREVARHD